ncbi:MAG: hypothetical protein Q4D34_07880, partial [Eggerthellaceae bacterium]|nr:hypothetical protein [Eggerthellaceae bacterium]
RVLRVIIATVSELFCGNDRAYLIIDSQEKDLARVHTRIRAILEDMGRLDFIDRIVPEIYFEREYEAVKAVSPYQHWLLSLYKHKELDETVYADIVDFCASHGVKVLTMGKKRANRQRSYIANKKGLTVAVHTVNTKKGWQQLRDAGARLAFTDKLYPKFDA